MIEGIDFGKLYNSDPVFLPEKEVNREGTFKCERNIECRYCDHKSNCSYTHPKLDLDQYKNKWSDYPLGFEKIYTHNKEYYFKYNKKFTTFIDISKLERGKDYATFSKNSKGFYNLLLMWYFIPKDKHQLENEFIILDTVEELIDKYDIYTKMPYLMRKWYNPKNGNICMKLELIK